MATLITRDADERDREAIRSVLLCPPRRFGLADDTSMAMPVAEVRLLAVAPAGRGHGVGAALQGYLLDFGAAGLERRP